MTKDRIGSFRATFHRFAFEVERADRLIGSEDFEAAYQRATAEQTAEADRLARAGDMAGLRRWIKERLPKRPRTWDEIPATEVRDVASQNGIPNASRRTKPENVALLKRRGVKPPG